MDALAQRIAPPQHSAGPHRQALADPHLECKPAVHYAGGERSTLAQQIARAARELADRAQQRRRRAIGAEGFDRGAAIGERIERNVNAVEIAIVSAAIL